MLENTILRGKTELIKTPREEVASESYHIASSFSTIPPYAIIRAGQKNRLFKRLKAVGFVKKIGRFVTVKVPLDEELKILRTAAVHVQGSTLFAASRETLELFYYRTTANEILYPLGVLLGRKLRKACWGSHYQRHGDMVSLCTTEVFNTDGTIAAYPHLHFVCEAQEKITTALVANLWKDIVGPGLPDNPVNVQCAPFRKGPAAIVRYVLKQVTPETPADVYPISLITNDLRSQNA